VINDPTIGQRQRAGRSRTVTYCDDGISAEAFSLNRDQVAGIRGLSYIDDYGGSGLRQSAKEDRCSGHEPEFWRASAWKFRGRGAIGRASEATCCLHSVLGVVDDIPIGMWSEAKH
jgi:hypothetical protein